MKRLSSMLLSVPLCFAVSCAAPSVDPINLGGGEGEGEGEAGGNGGDDEDPVLEPASELAQELCRIWESGFSREVGALLGGGGGFARCSATDPIVEGPLDAEALAATCAFPGYDTAAQFDIAIAGGRVKFNLDKIRACSALSLEAAVSSTSCEGLFEPQQHEGDPCVHGWDCPTGTACETTDVFTQALFCLAPAGPGEFCDGTLRNCADGLFCGDNGLCAANAVLGASCDDATPCADGLRCADTDDDGDTECAELLAVAASCTDDSECANDTDASTPIVLCLGVVRDDNDVVTTPGTCKATLADGATCDPALATDVCEQACSVCAPTAALATTFACADRGTAGAACASSEHCAHGFVCNTTTGVCQAGSAESGACEADDDCNDGLVCGGGSTCLVRPGLGAPCGDATTSACTEGFCGTAGVCQTGAAGDACSTDDDCNPASGLGCNGQQCAPLPQVGQVCTADDGCAEGLVCDGNATCVPLAGVGDPCDAIDCKDGLYCTADTSVCARVSEAGTTCDSDDACASGTCLDGRCTAVPASCVGDPNTFQQFVVLSMIFPVLRRLRRRKSA